MKKLLIFSSVIFLTVLSYSKNTNCIDRENMLLAVDSQDRNKWVFDTLSYSQKIYIDNDTTKDGMQINLSFVYPISVSGNLDLKKVQGIFISLFMEEKPFSGTVREAFDKMIEKYVSQAVEYSNDWKEMGYEHTNFSYFEESKSSNIVTDTNYLTTISTSYWAYTGGAHGIYGSNYYNIDKRNGSVIEENLLFKPGYENKLATLIQDEITKRNSVDEYEYIGLLVELEEVKPNGNFFFSEEGITYLYNIYEITPYAQGIVEIVIPYEQIIPLVNENYLPIIKDISKQN